MSTASTAERVGSADEAPAKPVITKRKKRPFVIAAVLGLVAVAGGGWWIAHRGLESTDDAQIDADVVAVPARLGGTVVSVQFSDNQRVEAGALLVELDSASVQARL